MKHCQHCAQTSTKLDEFGYCIKYGCFERSGMKNKLEFLMQRASDLLFISESSRPLGIVSYVSNYYNPRTRAANDIMYDAKKIFGFVPTKLLERIPINNRERWDKNIRW